MVATMVSLYVRGLGVGWEEENRMTDSFKPTQKMAANAKKGL